MVEYGNRMKRFESICVSLAFVGLMLNSGCTKLNEGLPAPTSGKAQIHPAGWGDTNSTSFHGKVLKSESYDLNNCVSCHAKSFTGGVSGVTCFKCHASFPHATGWNDTSSAGFHGKILSMAQWQVSNCTPCHGTTLNGGTSSVSCFTCHSAYPHVTGWGDSSAVTFHGKFLGAKAWQLNNCTPCHGNTLDGGTSGKSCFTCHKSYPHGTGWRDSTTAAFHGNFIRASSWDMLQCKTCHGPTYGGGRVNVSCLTCHTKQNGPENCTTCHGGINEAPPRDLSGNILTTARGVGAHQVHLLGSSLASPLLCSECHNVPTSVYQAGHIGSTGHAEIHFNGPLGTLTTAGGVFVPAPSYDAATGKCNNTFCHGNWRLQDPTATWKDTYYTDTAMAGANYSPSWTGGSPEAACGSCHGLPPAGHAPYTIKTCVVCHSEVVDGNGNIIDKTKHMNGKVNVFGQPEYNF